MILPEIGAAIAVAGLGILGDDLFLGEMPESPDECVTIYEYQGAAPQFTHDGDEVHQPRVQIVVRSVNYAVGRLKIERIRVALQQWNAMLSGVRYVSLAPTSDPFFLTRDDNRRVKFAVNFEAQKEGSPV